MRCYLAVFLIAAAFIVAYPAQRVTVDIDFLDGNGEVEASDSCYIATANLEIGRNEIYNSGDDKPCEQYVCSYIGELRTVSCNAALSTVCYNGTKPNQRYPYCCFKTC